MYEPLYRAKTREHLLRTTSTHTCIERSGQHATRCPSCSWSRLITRSWDKDASESSFLHLTPTPNPRRIHQISRDRDTPKPVKSTQSWCRDGALRRRQQLPSHKPADTAFSLAQMLHQGTQSTIRVRRQRYANAQAKVDARVARWKCTAYSVKCEVGVPSSEAKPQQRQVYKSVYDSDRTIHMIAPSTI
jgi:hypothetical protein